MFCEAKVTADRTEDASFDIDYSNSFIRYVLHGSDDALKEAIKLGNRALAERHKLLDLLAVHHRLLAPLIERPLGQAGIRERFARAQEFLTQASAPFGLAHDRWHEMAHRLGVANEELKTRVVKRTNANGEAMERLEQAQQVAVAARAELDHATRLMARGEMAAAIAHEINQPLTGIVAQANAAARWLAGSPPDLVKVRNALERIIGAGHHASEIIGSIRAMFKRENDKKIPFDVNDVIEETITLAQAELEDQCVTVQVGLATDLPHVLGDRVQMQQVVFNLVVNAVDAMRAVTDRPRVLTITSAMQDRGGVTMTVQDSGIGIRSKIIDRIFDPFYTTKSRGMGMGLSICRSIVEALDGDLSVSSRVDQGTVFHIVLPNPRMPLAES